ncbi:MAG: hypothetical protein JXR83_13425 [Deltaproteobacteria bacterium]|nr:hypothetical protein [Deltaproteobacteria bacterium]
MTHPHDQGQKPRPRQPYQAPRLSKVKLRPEETVLGGCKSAGMAGPLQSACTVPSPCGAPGS